MLNSHRDPTSSVQQLFLVRHARSAHVHRGWIDIDGFERWRAAYDAAGIGAHETPPEPLQQLVRAGAMVVSSDMPRALASARLLRADAPDSIPVSPLLRELDHVYPTLGGVRVPLAAWALTIGLASAARMLRGTYPTTEERARIADASRWLGEIANANRTVIALTHGSFRRQLTNALRRDGWRWERDDRSVRPWSAWRMTRDAG